MNVLNLKTNYKEIPLFLSHYYYTYLIISLVFYNSHLLIHICLPNLLVNIAHVFLKVFKN